MSHITSNTSTFVVFLITDLDTTHTPQTKRRYMYVLYRYQIPVQLVAIKLTNLSPSNCSTCRHQTYQLVAIKLSNLSPSNCSTCGHQIAQLGTVTVKLSKLSPSNCPTCRRQTVQLVAIIHKILKWLPHCNFTSHYYNFGDKSCILLKAHHHV